MSAGLWGALAGAGLGALQYGDKKRQQEHNRMVAAETARYSPWTGMRPQPVGDDPSLLGTLGQGALSGASFGQQFGGAAPAPGPNGGAAPQEVPPPGFGLSSLGQMSNPWALRTNTQMPMA